MFDCIWMEFACTTQELDIPLDSLHAWEMKASPPLMTADFEVPNGSDIAMSCFSSKLSAAAALKIGTPASSTNCESPAHGHILTHWKHKTTAHDVQFPGPESRVQN